MSVIVLLTESVVSENLFIFELFIALWYPRSMEKNRLSLSENQLDTLRHMLGINTPNEPHPRPTRNYATVEKGSIEFATLSSMGLIEKMDRVMTEFGYDYFQVTDQGRALAMESHKSIQKSKSARRYVKFLEVVDAVPDLSFREFLTDPQYERSRQEA